MKKAIWKHKKKFKGRTFFGNAERDKQGRRDFKFVDTVTGRETKPYSSHEAAKKDGWIRVK